MLRTHDFTYSYMGGFTQPKQLRSANWYHGGPYVERRKVYVPPDADAYHPRTVYLLEGRHPTVHGPGRVDAFERKLGTCVEGDFPRVGEYANTTSASEYIEAMDNARWPWDSPRPHRRVRWWEPSEDPKQIRQRALEDNVEASAETTPAEVVAAELRATRLERKARSRSVPPELLAAGPSRLSARALHTSAATQEDDRSPFEKRREDMPTSAWSRPPRPSQDAHDDVVPVYYVERKKQRETISQRKEEEGGLMNELNAGILSEGLAAATRVREEKIPVELRLPDGTVLHPSGFEPPTAETEFHPVAAKVATEDHPLLATVKQPWDEREFIETGADPIEPCPQTEAEWIKRMVESGGIPNPGVTPVRDLGADQLGSADASSTTSAHRKRIRTSAWDPPSTSQSRSDDPDSVVPEFYVERKKMRESIDDSKETAHKDLMHELNTGILAEEVAAQIRHREEKIPVEVTLEDGTVAHASGFEPPTAETEFHPIAAKPGDVIKQPWDEALATNAKKPSDARGFHTSAVARAQVAPMGTFLERMLALQGMSLNDAPQPQEGALAARRARYAQEAPFWRPLLTVTVASRPLAHSVERLSNTLSRGRAFVHAIEDDERKEFSSFNARMRNLQLDRVQALTRELALKLGGAHGGLLGLRNNATERGRGVNGEGMADPVPDATRVIKIGVGEWYPFAEEVKERFLADAEEGGYARFVEVFGVDEWGRRTDGKQWAGERQRGTKVAELVEKAEGAAEELDVD